MKRRLEIATHENGDTVTQTITYRNHKIWFDSSLALYRLRSEIERVTKLNLELIGTEREDNVYRAIYAAAPGEDINQFDGNFFIMYTEPRKICATCISYKGEVNYCNWKGEELIRLVKRCDGYLENPCLTKNLK